MRFCLKRPTRKSAMLFLGSGGASEGISCWESLKTDPEFSSKTDPPCYCINYSVSVDKLSFFVSESPFLFGFLFVFFLLDSLCLKRQDSFPVSTIWQWCVSRSNNAVVIFASPNTLGHSAKLKFVVIANTQSSGNVCIRAYSLTVKGLVSSGWQRVTRCATNRVPKRGKI